MRRGGEWTRLLMRDLETRSIKRRIGACERLDCPQDGPSHGVCKAECERCYDWDHQEAATKEICISQIFYGETYKFVARVGPSVELVEHFVA